MDDIDAIVEKEQVLLDARLGQIRRSAHESNPTPHCVECGDDMPEGRVARRCVPCQTVIENRARRR